MQRRSFLRTGTALAAPLAFPALLRSAAPNSRLGVAVLGVSRTANGDPGRGTELALALAAQPNIELLHLCDVDERHLGKAIETLGQKGARPKPQVDLRTVMADKGVDAVVIATPDHWHTAASLLACEAGKHIYLEAPCTQNAAEGEILAAAAKRAGVVIQHGTQRRSWPAIQEAMAKLREGIIGRPISARAVYYNSRLSVGRGNKVPPPTGLNWDLWQGPAPARPYQDNFVNANWRWFWNWGTGEVGSSGIHLLDLCRWGMNLPPPTRIASSGIKARFGDDQETPDTHMASMDFVGKSPFAVTWESRSWSARTINDPKYDVAFYGESGSLLITGSAYAAYDPAGREIARGAGSGGVETHLRNFADAIRGNATLNAGLTDGLASALLVHLVNLAWRASRTLMFDPTKMKITNDLGIDKLWKREYREGWEPR